MSAAKHRQGAAAPPPSHPLRSARPAIPRSDGAEPPLRSLVELLRRRAAGGGRGAGAGYLFLDDRGAEAESLGWSDLDRRARAVAAALAAAGAAPGDRALLLHPPGLAFVSAFFGCLYAGVVAVPGYPPRSRRGLPRVAAVAIDSGARLALTTGEEKPKFEALTRAAAEAAESDPALAAVGDIEWLASDRVPADGAEEWDDPGAGPETLAFLQYTSGSTAAPKGVMVSHGNLLHNQEAIRRAFAQSESSVVVGWLPLYHDMGLIGNVLQPLYAGARCVLMSPLAFLQRPRLWLETIDRYRGTTSGGPNFAYELCTARIAPEERAGLDLSTWAVAFNGAEPVRAATLDRFARAFAPCGFRRRAFLPCYGLAEATLLVAGEPPTEEPRVAGYSKAALERGRAEEAAGDGARPLVACGGAAGGQRLEIVDPETGRPRGAGEVGEIWVAGPSVAAGYWRRPAETAEAFGARLAGDGGRGGADRGGGDRFLRTGDLGFLAGGRLVVTGRIKDLVIIRGRNHYPHDVERTAEASHPALRAGCGAAFAIDRDGEDRLAIAQEVEREAVRTADPAALAAAIRAAVAEGHDLEVETVALLAPGGVPKTSSGKVQRRACRRMLEQGTLKLLHLDRLDGGGTAVPAATPEADDGGEATADLAELIEIVRREAAPLLRVAAADLDADRPLPLDSLAAMELKARLEGALGVALPLEGFFDGPTPRSLARAAAAAGAAGEPAPAMLAAEPTASEPEPAELPLSPGQRALWFVDRLARAAGAAAAVAAYHVAVAVRAPGGLDPAALASALSRLAARHPALTATFHDGERGPVQRTAATEDAAARRFLTVVPAEDLDAGALRERLAAEAARPFDLETGPPFRAVLFRAPDGDLLLWAFHHLAVDLWSLVVLAEELAALYPAALAGDAVPELPAPGLRRGDRLRRQEEVLAGPEGERLAAFWRQELAGAPAVLELPTDRPRPPVQSFRAGTAALRLEPAEWSAVERLAAAAGATPFAALLAGWQAVLGRWSGQDDVVVGTVAAGRARPGLERLVGYLANPLPLRARLDAPDDRGPGLGALTARAGRSVVAALAHQELPFPRLVEELAPRRDPARPPLVQAFLAFQRPHRLAESGLAALALGRGGAPVSLGGLALESVALPRGGVQFELELVAAEVGGALEAALHYAADLFEPATAERLAAALRTLLAAGAAEPERALRTLPLLPEADRRQLLADWDGAALERPAAGLHGIAAERAAATPDAPAVIALEAGESGGGAPEEGLSYRELDRAAAALAACLAAAGAGPETVVAVALPHSAALVAAFLAVLRAGACYLPLDPAYPRERLRFMLEDSGARAVVTTGGTAAALGLGENGLGAAVGGPVPVLLAGTGCSAVRALAGEIGEAPPPAPPHPEAAAYAIYTSGSTGRPKGALLTHRGLTNLALAQARAFGVGAESRVLLFAALSFDASISEIGMALAAGAALCTAPAAELAPGPPLAGTLDRLGITHVTLPPSTLAALPEDGLPALRTLVSAGEPLPAALAARWAGERALINAYGPTEVTVCASLGRVDPERLAPGLTPGIGRPLDNARCAVLDRGGEPAPPGVPGELWVGGAGLARGYLGRPGLTADRFRPEPRAGRGGPPAGARLYRTGDLVRWRDRELEFLGRLDGQVKVRGFRVEPGEVEAALAALPGVREAAVAVRGEGAGARLVGYAVPEPGARLSPAALRSALAGRLPGHLVPGAVVVLEALPRSPAGKVDRRALPAPRGSAAGDAAPAGDLERAVAAIWRDLLGVERVGLDDGFFDLGGHSLLLAQLHRRLDGVLPRPVSLVDLYRHPTIRSLVRAVAGDRPGAAGRPKAPRARRRAAARANGAETESGAVAVVGMACRFPGAASPEELWRRLAEGADLVRDLTDEELRAAGVTAAELADPAYVKAAPVLDGVDLFDPEAFGYNPAEAAELDPQQRLLLECAVEALEDAGCDPARAGDAIGVFAGAGMESYLLRLLAAAGGGDLDPAAAYQLTVGNLRDFLATRVAYKLGLTGPAVAVQTACSTSLVAVHLACRSLLAGECDAALAGGVSLAIPPGRGYRHQPGMILSPDGRCRPFSADAAGTVRGSGAGLVLLRRLDDALAAGDRIRAVVRGSAINNDGAEKAGFTAPSVGRQAAAIAAALAAAGVEPATVGYVEAHGTGTAVGDPIEIAALAEALGPGVGRPRLIGSIKSNLGHCDAAAGIAGLIKTVLALEAGEIPPSLHCERPHPGIDFDGAGFRVATERTPWEPAPLPGGGTAPRRAGVSSFGIGGTNAHAVLEEAPRRRAGTADAQEERPPRPVRLLALSAASPAALDAGAAALAERLETLPDADLAAAEATLHLGRRALERRRVAVCRDAAGGAAALRTSDPERVYEGRRPAAGRTAAFLFPGQGAQHPGMGLGLYRAEPAYRRWLDRAAELAAPALGLDLRRLLDPEPGAEAAAAATLAETRITQPALFAVEHALARLWLEWGVEPAAMLGHSIGELVAAVVAGVLSFEDGVALVAARGALMQEMPPGAMLALPLAEEEALAALAEAGEESLALAAVNAPDAVVVAGPEPALAAFAGRLEGRGVEGRRLRTSHAFHSPSMAPAAERFAERVAEVALAPPERRFVSNLSGRWIAAAEATDPGYWAEQMLRPVRFADGVATLLAEPGTALLEAGPGNALCALGRRHPAAPRDLLAVPSLPHPRKGGDAEGALETALETAVTALGRLWAGGVEVDWDGFHAGERRWVVALPTYRFQRRRCWIDAVDRPGSQASRSTAAGLAVAGVTATPAGESAAAGSVAGVGAGVAAGVAGQPAGIEGWFHLPSWRPTPPPAGVPDPSERWLLLVDEAGVGAALIRRLRAAGCAVAAAAPGAAFVRRGPASWTLRPGERADFERLLAALAEEGGPPRRIVHLWTLAARDRNRTTAETLDLGVHTLLALAQALVAAAPGAPPAIAVVTAGARAVGAEAPQPERAAILGPCRVLPQEVPGLACRSLDVEPPGSGRAAERVAALLLADLAGAGPAAPPVAYRGGVRWLEETVPAPLPPAAEAAVPTGPALVTGGFGGLGAALARRLAARPGARLALLARTPLPERSAWDAAVAGGRGETARRIELVRELEALGAEVLPLAADVADVAALRTAVARARERFGRLDLVVHAAGVAAGGPVQGLGRAGAAAVLAPKVAGTRALEAAFGETPPATVVLFSSLAAAVGGFGQADYAAANCALDAFAEGWAARHPESWCCAVAWGGWDGVGMAASGPRAGLGALPGGGIRPEEGIEALERILAHRPGPRVLVTPAPPAEVAAFHARLAADPGALAAPAAGKAGAGERTLHPRPDLQTPYAEPRGDLEERIAAVWRRLLALERVGANDNFFELGGTSLLGVQVVTEVQRATGAELPAVSLYEGSSVRALAALIERRRGAGGGAESEVRSGGETAAQGTAGAAAGNGSPPAPAPAAAGHPDNSSGRELDDAERAAEERGRRRLRRLASRRAGAASETSGSAGTGRGDGA